MCGACGLRLQLDEEIAREILISESQRSAW
jgi:hypothetical protein